ncbi:intraceullular sulfur oxidation protein of DsrE family protein [Psychromonas sp. CNPT3]|uniref:sulfurtransferase complex subunit TusC n=1 Tax=Psychromonas sp. CNPT3 TaxID=314282 RepID=UPI00006E9E55|nr:sulfurtransferase complex subunit TusC [Psychromonas sp. CNPT3]AGH82333.1 intraceullular sulfur oxidation protein of DsrE family protein [Psychromonas sp. CNPT3]
MKQKKIGIINRAASHGSAQGREALDLTLALSAFNESLSVFFMGDAVYQLLIGQDPDEILQKNFAPLFKMLALYDVENIYVCAEALAARHLQTKDLLIEVSVLDKHQLQQQLARQDQLLSF